MISHREIKFIKKFALNFAFTGGIFLLGSLLAVLIIIGFRMFAMAYGPGGLLLLILGLIILAGIVTISAAMTSNQILKEDQESENMAKTLASDSEDPMDGLLKEINSYKSQVNLIKNRYSTPKWKSKP